MCQNTCRSAHNRLYEGKIRVERVVQWNMFSGAMFAILYTALALMCIYGKYESMLYNACCSLDRITDNIRNS